MRLIGYLILTCAIVAGCDSDPTGPTTQPTTLAVTRIATGSESLTYYSGLNQPARVVIRDAAAWQQMWSSIWRLHTPEPPLPAIDFSREMVIVAALGVRNTGGYSIAIAAASETSNGVTVEVRSISPGPRCGTTQALTQPVDAARVPRRDVGVSFSERAETIDCQ